MATQNSNGVVVQEEGESSSVNGSHVTVHDDDNGDEIVSQDEGEFSNVNVPHVPVNDDNNNGDGIVVQEGEYSNVNTPHVPVPLNGNTPHVPVPLNDDNNDGDGLVIQEEGESSIVNTTLVINKKQYSNCHHGIKKQYSNWQAWGVLPPIAEGNPNRKTLVLDLDETLVHSSVTPLPAGYDFSITLGQRRVRPSLYVSKRPGVDELLQHLGATGLYEIVVFTAACKEYADAVVDALLDSLPPTAKGLYEVLLSAGPSKEYADAIVDSLPATDSTHINRKNIIPSTHRLYRGQCSKVEGVINDVKDLSVLGRDLKNVIFLDDRSSSYHLQPQNAIPIQPWVGEDSEDKTIFKILFFCLLIADSTTDVRELISNYISFFTYE